MVKIFLFLTGFGFSVIGLVYTISYLNLITLGYNLQEYGKFICRRPECLIGIFGLILVFLVIFLPKGEDTSDIHI